MTILHQPHELYSVGMRDGFQKCFRRLIDKEYTFQDAAVEQPPWATTGASGTVMLLVSLTLTACLFVSPYIIGSYQTHYSI